MFTVAVVEDDETAVAKLRACLDQYAATHAGVQFDVTVFNVCLFNRKWAV
ncbi:hypothetical protein [Bifidobacterium longum]|nr:hypothetical protein [Bifidobacterium longum]